MTGFLTPQGSVDCCCNGTISNRCQCVAGGTVCSLWWSCYSIRDQYNLPVNAPHKIRLVRTVDAVDVILFETALVTGEWFPPRSHEESTSYRIEVCCNEPVLEEDCIWLELANIEMNGTVEGCEECEVISLDCCEGFRTEGEPPEIINFVIAVDSLTHTFTFLGVNYTSEDWSGVYVLACGSPNPCGAQQNYIGPMTLLLTNAFGSYHYQSNMSITITKPVGLVWRCVVDFSTAIYFTPSGGSQSLFCTSISSIKYESDSGGDTMILAKVYADCDALQLVPSMNTDFDFINTTQSNTGSCGAYPIGFNPVISVGTQ